MSRKESFIVMPHEVATVTGFPERIDFAERDDFYMRLSRESDAEAVFRLVTDNPYIGQYQYWARDDTLEKTQEGVRERMAAIKAGTSIQYKIIVPAETDYDGIVGTLTAYDYDKDLGMTKIGYYQAESAQGKGRMITSVAKLIGVMKSAWGLRTVEFDIEDGNERSERLVQKLGAVRTEDFKDYDCDGRMIPNRIWRLAI